VLTNPKNVAADGLPWAFGLASINFFDGYLKADGTVDASVSKTRLDALASYFEKRRDLFIGIKLAHPHQQVAFDDERYLGVYAVAAKYSVPVYLHTGFSPFANAKNERAFYDPEGLRNTIKNNPGVKFVLGHVGQGDALAVEHCLSLAQEMPNVFLEISALNRPILRDLDGHDVAPDKDKPQYPYVLEQIKKRGLVDKTIFGTDGPQYAGMVRSYAKLITDSMKEKGFSDAEIAKVMSRNFLAVYFGVS
jgi:predicted TIM-barrel fold metal-dependent hydrolase